GAKHRTRAASRVPIRRFVGYPCADDTTSQLNDLENALTNNLYRPAVFFHHRQRGRTCTEHRGTAYLRIWALRLSLSLRSVAQQLSLAHRPGMGSARIMGRLRSGLFPELVRSTQRLRLRR